MQAGSTVVHFDTQFNQRWNQMVEMPIHHMKGNLSFATNSPAIAVMIEEWSWCGNRHYAPKCLEDVEQDETLNDD